MNAKKLLSLAIVTGLVALLATYVINRRDSATAADGGRGPLLPAFGESINDVAEVRIEKGTEAFTLERDGADWGLKEKKGYAVDASQVRTLLLALRNAKIVETKTSNPELYSKIGVQDVDDSEESSTLVTVTAKGGEELASLIVGKSGGRGPTQSFYVRKSGEAQSLLAEGEIGVAGTQNEWLQRAVINAAADQILGVHIAHADGEAVRVVRPEGSDTPLELQDIPEGKELRYERAADSVATGLANLQFDDVLEATEVEFPDPPLARCTFWLEDGVKVLVDIHETEDETLYAKLAAEVDLEGPERPAIEGPPASESETEQAEGPDPDAAERRATEIQAMVEGWVYELPSWKKNTFAKRADDLLKDLEPPPEPVGDAPVELPGNSVEGPGESDDGR